VVRWCPAGAQCQFVWTGEQWCGPASVVVPVSPRWSAVLVAWLPRSVSTSSNRSTVLAVARSVAQWVAERDSNPRLMLRALTVETGES
jgi:hypothetical protein